jgi:hypothetical protein
LSACVLSARALVAQLCVGSNNPQVSIMRDAKLWCDAAAAGGGDHCILFVDDSIAEHLDDGFDGFNCVRVLFTRGVKGQDDDA